MIDGDEARREAVRKLVGDRLGDAGIRQNLADLITHYYYDFRETVTFAEVMCDGVRPEGLANEVYSCFQHIARGLGEADADPSDELDKARHSHLKRMGLDAHKILINRSMEECRAFLDATEQAKVHPQVESLVEGGVEAIAELQERAWSIRDRHHEAKKAEGRGVKGEDPTLQDMYRDVALDAIRLARDVKACTQGKAIFYALREYYEEKQDRKAALKCSENANTIASEGKRIAERSMWVAVGAFLAAILIPFIQGPRNDPDPASATVAAPTPVATATPTPVAPNLGP